MESTLFKAGLGMVAVNALVLVWLVRSPMPPDRIPAVPDVEDPYKGDHDITAPETPATMAALDGILAARLTQEAASRGVEPLLPDAALRAEAAGAAPETDAALRLLAAYERGFDALGLSLDGLGR